MAEKLFKAGHHSLQGITALVLGLPTPPHAQAGPSLENEIIVMAPEALRGIVRCAFRVYASGGKKVLVIEVANYKKLSPEDKQKVCAAKLTLVVPRGWQGFQG